MYHISKDKRSEQSSEWIFEALKKLMAQDQKDLSSIKITDVVEEAKVGRTTFYRNFDSLEDVLRYKCDQEFEGCAVYLKQSVFNAKTLNPKAPFLLPFIEYWYTHFAIIELLVNANREDIIKTSFIKMAETLRSEYAHIEIKHYNYFIEMRAAISIALLSEWVRTNRAISPAELVEIFDRQMLLDDQLFSLVKPNR